jgi:acetyl esterase/lipase
MSLTLDPEVADAMAAMGEATAGMTPPAVGDVGARRAMWEPILDASGKAQPIPEDVTTHDYVTATDEGAQITMRWYAKNDTTPGSAVLFFHGGGYLFGHIEHFDGPVTRYVSASGVPMLSAEHPNTPTPPRSRTPTPP